MQHILIIINRCTLHLSDIGPPSRDLPFILFEIADGWIEAEVVAITAGYHMADADE